MAAEGIRTACQDRAVPEPRPLGASAGWQDGFTEGADEEYVEQILPLAAHWLGGAVGVLDVGCGEGQVARLAAAGGVRGGGRRPDVGADPAGDRAAAGPPMPGRGGGPCRSPTVPSTTSSPASCSSTSATSTSPSPRWPAVLGTGGRFAIFLNHPPLQTPDSGWIDDQVLDPPEQYWRIGPYLVEDETLEEVEKGVFIPFIHRPLSR